MRCGSRDLNASLQHPSLNEVATNQSVTNKPNQTKTKRPMINFTTQPTKGLVVPIRQYPGNIHSDTKLPLTAHKPTQTNFPFLASPTSLKSSPKHQNGTSRYPYHRRWPHRPNSRPRARSPTLSSHHPHHRINIHPL